MPHIIILNEIDAQQGENTTGTGVLETLRGRANAAEAFIETADKDNPVAEALEAKLDQIASTITGGYTASSLGTLSDELQVLIP